MLIRTTLLSSPFPLFYSNGQAYGLPSGVPALNTINHTFYFTGRSDNFDPTRTSTNPWNARFDTEGARVSNDGRAAKLEGVTFGQDVTINGETKHTLYIANDNDYSAVVPNKNHVGGTAENPNKLFVFAFGDDDLPGFVPQNFRRDRDRDGDHGGHD